MVTSAYVNLETSSLNLVVSVALSPSFLAHGLGSILQLDDKRIGRDTPESDAHDQRTIPLKTRRHSSPLRSSTKWEGAQSVANSDNVHIVPDTQEWACLNDKARRGQAQS